MMHEVLRIAGRESSTLVRKGADLFANYAAIVSTGLSWFFVASWIMG